MSRRPKTNPAIKRLMPLMNRYFTRRFGAKEGAEKSAGTIMIAQRYWDETPYIGGRENLLSGNLYMSEVLFAAVEACGRDFPGEDILALGEELGREAGVTWLPSDFKKQGREMRATELAEAYGLYRQLYCGCEYSLRKREEHAAE